MSKNRDAENGKRAERQIETAGKFPFHRLAKIRKRFDDLVENYHTRRKKREYNK